MKLTIIAATSGLGRQLLDQALDTGHDVTAVVRNSARLTRPGRSFNADLVTGQFRRPPACHHRSRCAAISPGPHSNADAGIVTTGARVIVEAMQADGVRRIAAVSAAPFGTYPLPSRPHPPKHDPVDGFFMRYLGSRFAKAKQGLRRPYSDGVHRRLKRPGLDRRPAPRLTDKPLTARYRAAYQQNPHHGTSAAAPTSLTTCSRSSASHRPSATPSASPASHPPPCLSPGHCGLNRQP